MMSAPANSNRMPTVTYNELMGDKINACCFTHDFVSGLLTQVLLAWKPFNYTSLSSAHYLRFHYNSLKFMNLHMSRSLAV